MLAVCALWGLSAAAPPNTSFATLPVGYYGSSWPVKTPEIIDMLSKMRMIGLMQEDGECWIRCCPHQDKTTGKCQTSRTQHYNATENPGCNPSCDQHGKQDEVFTRVKAAAVAAGRPEPHAILYVNTDYSWPFDLSNANPLETTVLDIHGIPHVEQCDPGIYPSYFFDHGRAAGRAAWLSIFQNYVANGTADGVFLDCFDTSVMHCEGNICKAIRHKDGNNASIVTKASADAWNAGMNVSLQAATKLVAATKRGIFSSKTWQRDRAYGPNTAILPRAADADEAIANIQHAFDLGYTYTVNKAGYSSPVRSIDDIASDCSDREIGSFMMAMRTGSFIWCNGWDDRFGYPLGEPVGPAAPLPGLNGSLFRAFESGTNVTRMPGGQYAFYWAGAPPPTPAPPLPPPGPYQGCWYDKGAPARKAKPCDLPVVKRGGCPGGIETALEDAEGTPMTVELCNKLCDGHRYFGVQAGGNGCFCGATYGRYGPAQNSSGHYCDEPCEGDSSEICGGGRANSVYAVANSTWLGAGSRHT